MCFLLLFCVIFSTKQTHQNLRILLAGDTNRLVAELTFVRINDLAVLWLPGWNTNQPGCREVAEMWPTSTFVTCSVYMCVYIYIYSCNICIYWINRLHNLRAHVFSYCASHIFVHNASNWLENTKLHRHIHIRL